MTEPLADEVWTVGQLAAHVGETIADTYGALWVRGEVAEFKAWASGHWYFKLREGEAQLNCVMFKWANQRQRAPEVGQEVFAFVEPGLYAPRSEFKLTVKRLLATADLGAAAREKERVKHALQRDGLFELDRKRPLPALARRVAVVTSANGAALQDIITVARRRWPLGELLVVPSLVQGEGAPAALLAALARVERLEGLDACIIGRGGGAREDLAAFDDEQVCRAVARCPVPVVSAVGHETDTSFCDLVADVRAATPSQAAELVFPDVAEVRDAVRQLGVRLRSALVRRTGVATERAERAGDRLEAAMRRRLAERRARLAPAGARLAGGLRQRVDRTRRLTDALRTRLGSATQACVGRDWQRHDDARTGLETAIRRRLARRLAEADALGAALHALSPLQVLDRGFGLARDADGRVLRRRADFTPSLPFTLRVADGDVAARVEPA